MRRLALPCFLLVALSAAPKAAHAEGGNFGIGLIIGSPTGLSLKYYISRGHAIDGAVGLTTIGHGGIHVHADYLWHPWVLASEGSFDLALYLGIGGRLLSHDHGRGRDDDIHIGPRGPVGVVFDFLKSGVPLDVFVEVALVVDFIIDDDEADDHHDSVDVDLNAGIGARYYF